jgi:DNA-binding transcriptional regulator YiaG
MDLKISQAKFSKLVGANRDMIANYEMGRCKPSADILMNTLALRDKQKKIRV